MPPNSLPFSLSRLLLMLTTLLLLLSVLQVNTQSIEVDYSFSGSINMRLINGVMSTPIRFLYAKFDSVDRFFCKYINSTQPFAYFGPEQIASNSRVLRSINSDYVIVNSTIGNNGYFGIKILGRLDRDDGKSIICQYATKFDIGSSSMIDLSVISPVIIKPFQTPASPIVGETVKAGCTIEGYPFPTVEIVPPRDLQFSSNQLSASSTKLTSYQYIITIEKIDETWNNERIFCSALQDGGLSSEIFVIIRIGDGRLPSHNPAVISGIIIGGLAALFLVVIVSVILGAYYKRHTKRRRNQQKNVYEARESVESEKVTEITSPGETTVNFDESQLESESERRVFRQPQKPTISYEVSTAAFV